MTFTFETIFDNSIKETDNKNSNLGKANKKERYEQNKFNPNLEYKATEKEKREAKSSFDALVKKGYSLTYAGGRKSKGHGFWVTAKNGKPLGYKSYGDCILLK